VLLAKVDVLARHLLQMYFMRLFVAGVDDDNTQYNTAQIETAVTGEHKVTFCAKAFFVHALVLAYSCWLSWLKLNLLATYIC